MSSGQPLIDGLEKLFKDVRFLLACSSNEDLDEPISCWLVETRACIRDLRKKHRGAPKSPHGIAIIAPNDRLHLLLEQGAKFKAELEIN
jgi:hypothetical protein